MYVGIYFYALECILQIIIAAVLNIAAVSIFYVRHKVLTEDGFNLKRPEQLQQCYIVYDTTYVI